MREFFFPHPHIPGVKADILGAISANMDSVFYNADNTERRPQQVTHQKPTFEIFHLVELMEIL